MDKQQWNNLVLENEPPFGGFLQSYEWGEFQQAIGRQVNRKLLETPNYTFIAQSIRLNLPFGQFYEYFPKGPLGNFTPNDCLRIMRDNYHGAAFIRFEPNYKDRLPAVKEVQPATTIIVDISQSEDEILAGMKSKTRYNVRLATKKGVEYKIHQGIDGFEDFWRLMKQTSVRDNFRSHTKKYYETMLMSIGQKGEAKAFMATASYKNRVISANMMIDFGQTRLYLHGATSNLHRNVMAQYGLHFFLMQDASSKGLTKFDFWGIAPQNAPSNHPWAGITRYKTGFGGDIIQMPGTYDFICKHAYYGLYKHGRRINRLLRSSS